MALLNKDDILNAKDIKTKTVSVPEWGGEVIIAAMSGAAMDEYESSVIGQDGNMSSDNVRAKLVAACLVDEKGDRLFNRDEVKKLGKKSVHALDRVFNAIIDMNKSNDANIEAMSKN